MHSMGASLLSLGSLARDSKHLVAAKSCTQLLYNAAEHATIERQLRVELVKKPRRILQVCSDILVLL